MVELLTQYIVHSDAPVAVREPHDGDDTVAYYNALHMVWRGRGPPPNVHEVARIPPRLGGDALEDATGVHYALKKQAPGLVRGRIDSK